MGLLTFGMFTYYIDIPRFGIPRRYSCPGDYLEIDSLGWLIMIPPILGIASPIIISLWFYWVKSPTISSD